MYEKKSVAYAGIGTELLINLIKDLFLTVPYGFRGWKLIMLAFLVFLCERARAFDWQTPIHIPPRYTRAMLLITQRAAFFLISNYSAN